MPDKATLRRWLEQEGLTRQQVVDRVEAETGVRVKPSAVSMAMSRYGLAPRRNRWDDLIPWRVKAEHQYQKEVILLRKLGRRKAGLANSEKNDAWLDSWLAELKQAGNPVVDYYEDTPEGFWYVPRVPEDGDGDYDVIRRPEVREMLNARK